MCFSLQLIEKQDVVRLTRTNVPFDLIWSNIVLTHNRHTHKCTHVATRSCLTPTHLCKQPNTPTSLQAADAVRLVVRVTECTFIAHYTTASAER